MLFRSHDQFNAALRAQGYDIDAFLDRFARASSWLEARVSPEIRLAATAAAEHFTAILAAGAFTRGLLDRAAPEMRALLAWHAAEEIEHKSVAFDVLQAVAPAYHVRVIGLAYATAVLGVFWGYGALMLMRQDGLGPRAARRALGRLPRRERIVRDVFLRGIRQYLARDFHPRNVDDGELAAAWMAANGVTLPRPVHEAA